MRKYLLNIGTIATAIAPIAMVVSCGGDTNPVDKKDPEAAKWADKVLNTLINSENVKNNDE